MIKSFYLQTQTVYFMKGKHMMLRQIFMKIRICLIVVNIQNAQQFLIL